MTFRPPNNLLNSEEGKVSLMEEGKISLMGEGKISLIDEGQVSLMEQGKFSLMSKESRNQMFLIPMLVLPLCSPVTHRCLLYVPDLNKDNHRVRPCI